MSLDYPAGRDDTRKFDAMTLRLYGGVVVPSLGLGVSHVVLLCPEESKIEKYQERIYIQ